MPQTPRAATVTIANGASESAAIRLAGATVFSIFLPTLTSGTCRLQGSYDGTNWFDMKDAATSPATLEYGTNTGNFVMDGDYTARFLGIPFVRVKTSVNQGADRTINYVICRE